MIGKVFVMLLAFAMPIAQAQGKSVQGPSQHNPLVGTWRLVSFTDTPKGGEPAYMFGKNPIGQIIFTADGHMSVHVMHNPPNPKDAVTATDPDSCMPSWYCGYFGTYTVGPKGHYWVTHVLGGNIVAYNGTNQKRTFRIEGNRLIIFATYTSDGVQTKAERVLVRYDGLQK